MSRFVGVSFAVALLASIASTASAADTYPPGPSYRPTCTDSVTLFQVQQADTTLNPCYPLIGDTVKGIRGIITGFRLRSSGHIYMQNSNGSPYNAMMVFTVGHTESQGFAVGDSISVCGLMQAYQGMSQIQGSLGTSLTVRKISSGNPLPPYPGRGRGKRVCPLRSTGRRAGPDQRPAQGRAHAGRCRPERRNQLAARQPGRLVPRR
jgi:hypothetical protein